MTKSVRQLILFCSLLVVAGCARQIEPLEPLPGYAALPTNCTAALEPLEDAVRSFAGELHDSPVSSEHGSLTTGNFGQLLSCSAKYAQSLPDSPIGSARMPMARGFRVSYNLSLSAMYVGTTRAPLRDFLTDGEKRSAPVRIDGVGEDAVGWVEEGPGPVLASVRARIGNNLIVSVYTYGKDWQQSSPAMPVNDSPELREELLDDATAIAAAIARHAESALPTTVLEWPSGEPETSAPTSPPATTTSSAGRPLWNPCETTESRIIAAGLSTESVERGNDPRAPSCRWTAAAGSYNLRITSFSESIESRVYNREDTYTRPRLLDFDGRPALMFTWTDSQLFCDVAFDVSQGPDSEPAMVLVEASANVPGEQTQLCEGAEKAAAAVAGAVPHSW